ncbi:MAG: SDR family oxidoreductase [Rubrobacteraceae bacterium]
MTTPRATSPTENATTAADTERAVNETVEAFGPIDVVICCVGLWDYFTPLDDIPEDRLDAAFDEIFSVNVKSNLITIKAALPHLLQTEGNVVLTVSNSGFYAAGGSPLYTATKFATRGLIIQMAYELAPKVRVNGVAPGGTVTQLRGLDALDQREISVNEVPDIEQLMRTTNPLQILATPEDHAWAYTYLASQRAAAVTGTIINSDGGLGSRGVTKMARLLDLQVHGSTGPEG